MLFFDFADSLDEFVKNLENVLSENTRFFQDIFPRDTRTNAPIYLN